jgi:UDP-GlcNAc:undecaprenyl-phosphate/decaprenyl-phosphate GlcNAc-1-phosphate transferase
MLAAALAAITARMSFRDSLHALLYDGDAVWGFLMALVIVLGLTPLAARLSPRTDERDRDRPRVHTGFIPRTGGVAIVAAILVPAAFFLDLEGPYLGILLGTLGVAVLGLVDDVRGISPRTKLLGVALLALIPVVGYDVSFGHITLPLVGNHDIGTGGYLLTIFWVVLLANLVNLIDGMDALAAGIVAIAAGSFALLAASFGRIDASVLAAIICGSTLGFLRYNYHPAKVFMGDSGALALGFLLALVAVEGLLKTAATITLVAPMLVIAVPILDTSFVVLKRLKYGRVPWGADHNHFYHRFMRIGFSQRRAAAYLHVWAAGLATYAILLRFVPPRPGGEWDLRNALIGAAAGIVVLAGSVWMVYTLEILKARHLRVLGLSRFAGDADEDSEEAVEEVLTAGRR